MIRTLWFLISLIALSIFHGTVTIVSGLIRVPNRPGGVFDWALRNWSRGMLRMAGTPVTVVGLEHVPAGQPVVYISNHQSWFDIWLLGGHLPGQVRFVAKKELRKVPFLGGSIQAAGHIYIDRQSRQAAIGAYKEAAAQIRNGMSAGVFAEGTRSPTGELLPFKKGPFVLAIAAQVPVVPVYCAGTFNVLPKKTMRLNSHRVALLVGNPIPTEGLTYDDREKLMKISRQRVEELREQSKQVLGSERSRDGRAEEIPV